MEGTLMTQPGDTQPMPEATEPEAEPTDAAADNDDDPEAQCGEELAVDPLATE
jgi:hypothetical protein